MKPTRYALAISAVFLAALAAIASGQGIWKSHGPTGAAWINDLAIADSVAYAATPNGVFRSLDRGETWQQSGLEGQSIRQIEARRGANVVLAVGGDGSLYVSRDRGESWAPLTEPSELQIVAIDPNDLSTIYAATLYSFLKSTDAGASWQTLPTPGDPPQAFAINSSAIYLLGNRRLYKSVDGGFGWTSAQPPLEYADTLATGAVDGVVYVAGFAAGSGSLCRSADSAATWTCSAIHDFPHSIFEIPGENPRLVASKSFSDTVFFSGDGGATWTQAGGGLRGPLTAFASDAAEALVLAGTDAQVFRTEDRGDTWTPFRAGLKAIKIGALALDPQRPSTIWASGIGKYPSSGPGLFRSTDTGLSWSPAGELPGVNALVIDPENPRTMYAGSNGIHRTEDGGETWTLSSSNSYAYLGAHFLALDPDHRRIWRGHGAGIRSSGGGLRYSNDGARTFQSVPSVTQTIYSILFDPRRPGSIYGGSYNRLSAPGVDGFAAGGSIFVSRDNGLTFTKGATNFGGWVISMAADPFEDILYAATGRGFRSKWRVLRSLDGGTTWELAGDGLTALNLSKIITDPVRPSRLYAATNLGVYRSRDGARTWEHIGLTYTSGELVITPDGRWLYAGTSGGVFQLDLELEVFSPCSATPTRLCLVGNRYAVDLSARQGADPLRAATARPLNDRAGYFGFPFATGDPDLPEVVVKMLAEGAFGLSGAPIFYSSLTTLPFVLTVTDTVTGQQQVYASDLDAPFCGGVDIAFGTPAASMSLRSAAAAGEPTLQLLGGRFSVTLEARHPPTGQIASGVAMSSGDRFGIFSLPDFTSDPDFPEVVVKMVDARGFTGTFWFFYTGLTSLNYTLTVTDSVSGAVRTYESGAPFCGGADTDAFRD